VGGLFQPPAGGAALIGPLDKATAPAWGASWGRSLEVPGSDVRHDSDVGSQPSDPIKFCFSQLKGTGLFPTLSGPDLKNSGRI
jgi:hypothetical protein